ncbi:MAG TPA: amylo-alpha-1,6-glucosidase, partial [Burkholderiaceae bacterium]|nr:amylo-alpha-1,6-glucosidase [Burkholderiaceae bacterium]
MIPAPLTIRWRAGDDPARLRDLEWLTTNGFGGYASGSVLDIPTRRYHGVFVPNLSNPKGRFVLIPRIDEEIEGRNGWVSIGGAEFCDGRLECAAAQYLREFRLDAMTPVWGFDVEGSTIEKSIVMPHGQSTVCVRYRLLSGPPRRLRMRLFADARRVDAALQPRDEWPFAFELHGYEHCLTSRNLSLIVRLRARPDGTPFVVQPRMDRDVLFRVERDRGYDHSVHMYSPGYYLFELAPDASAALVATTESSEALEIDPESIFDAERSRLEHLLQISGVDARDEFAAHLVMAADQFIVVPGSRREEALLAGASGEQIRTVMAGYHWFNDWGRDTMIALQGLTLVTGRHGEARAILRTFAHYIRDGLLPNLFPEGGREALYHTVDATLWYFHALDRYLAHTGDDTLLAELFPALRDVVDHHVRGTRFGIGVDSADGLLHAGADGYQLTWMDAKVGDWVVTPRRGKPVEIQALWYNALRLMSDWAEALGAGEPRYRELAERTFASFNARYWSQSRGHLLDVVDGPDGDDPNLRPNQVFALSLRHPVLARERWRAVVDTIEQRLLTPYGLRTLDREHPEYKRYYEGPLRARDAAYHQGTVWPWLIGHFVDAWVRVHGRPDAARSLLQAFPGHLLDGGIGSVAEIFDADPPHRPRGCIAQAWSVAEVLRAWLATA